MDARQTTSHVTEHGLALLPAVPVIIFHIQSVCLRSYLQAQARCRQGLPPLRFRPLARYRQALPPLRFRPLARSRAAMPAPPPPPAFYPMDRRNIFAERHLEERWPTLEERLIRGPQTFRDLPGGRPFLKRLEYNKRRNN